MIRLLPVVAVSVSAGGTAAMSHTSAIAALTEIE
jgi:hypothetical protein